MCALSNYIREKANWREGVKYEVIVERWRREALQREEEDGEPPWRKLTPSMVINNSLLSPKHSPSSP